MGVSGDVFGCRICGAGRSSGQSPGMLLNILQCAGQHPQPPRQKKNLVNYLDQPGFEITDGTISLNYVFFSTLNPLSLCYRHFARRRKYKPVCMHTVIKEYERAVVKLFTRCSESTENEEYLTQPGWCSGKTLWEKVYLSWDWKRERMKGRSQQATPGWEVRIATCGHLGLDVQLVHTSLESCKFPLISLCVCFLTRERSMVYWHNKIWQGFSQIEVIIVWETRPSACSLPPAPPA